MRSGRSRTTSSSTSRRRSRAASGSTTSREPSRRPAAPPVGGRVIGHGDWSVKHFRFDGLRPTVIYDWDSLNTDREPVFAGVAAGTFTYTEAIPVALWPSADEAAAFIDAYEAARGARFGDDERTAAEAWATYVRAYAARCQHAVGDDVDRNALEDYVAAFVRA